ncbi:MAG: hypothetical protein GYA02_03860 [Clostridiaceae bacterium]|nr:hypothetical protein [Clostridiaceae bacterium]
MKVQEKTKAAIQKAIDEKLNPIISFLENIYSISTIFNDETKKLISASIESVNELKNIFSYIEMEIDYNIKGTDIEGFPFEVIQWMLLQQKIQGKEQNIDIFKKDRTTSVEGFLWSDVILPVGCKYTPESFCYEVIENKNFDLFYKVYPNKN